MIGSQTLTLLQAYKAMYLFLEEEYRVTQSEDIACLLGGMSLTGDGEPADSAMAEIWEESIHRVLSENVDIQHKFV